MSITVEFFGIPRQRAGVASATAEGSCLGEVLLDLAARYPELAKVCFDGKGLKTGFIANLNGRRFVADPETPLEDGEPLLILSADVGG